MQDVSKKRKKTKLNGKTINHFISLMNEFSLSYSCFQVQYQVPLYFHQIFILEKEIRKKTILCIFQLQFSFLPSCVLSTD